MKAYYKYLNLLFHLPSWLLSSHKLPEMFPQIRFISYHKVRCRNHILTRFFQLLPIQRSILQKLRNINIEIRTATESDDRPCLADPNVGCRAVLQTHQTGYDCRDLGQLLRLEIRLQNDAQECCEYRAGCDVRGQIRVEKHVDGESGKRWTVLVELQEVGGYL